MTARHLDQNTMGYLQWRWGPNSAMTTSVVRDTKRSHFTLALQVRTYSKINIDTVTYCPRANFGLYTTEIELFDWGFLYSYTQPRPFQLGVPHSYLMMSYQFKFQDEDQTKVKGSFK